MSENELRAAAFGIWIYKYIEQTENTPSLNEPFCVDVDNDMLERTLEICSIFDMKSSEASPCEMTA